MLTVGWNIKTIDRTAMIADVISEFRNMDVYIDSMHVSSCEIFIRFSIPSEKKLQYLLGNLLINNDILSIYPANGEPATSPSSHFAHIVISNYGVINDFNSSAEKVFSLLRHEMIGRNISALIDWEEVKDFRCGKVSTKEIENKITGEIISCTIRPVLHNNKITGANIILGTAKNTSLIHTPKSKKL